MVSPPPPPLKGSDPENMSHGAVLRQVRVIACALLVGEVIFAAIVGGLYAMNSAPISPDPTMRRIFLLVLIVLTAINLPTSFIVRRRLWNDRRDTETGGPTRTAFTQGAIVALALNEGYGLFGIVMAWIIGPEFFIFAAISLAVQIVLFPNRRSLLPNENPYRAEGLD